MQNPFDQIKSSLDIKEVFERYTMQEVYKNKALCPFHNDHNPSLSFKNDKFKCFVCQESGTSLDLIAKLFNLSILEAAKRLNLDYNLGLFPERLSQKQKIEFFKSSQNQEITDQAIALFNKWKNETEEFFVNVYRSFWRIFIDCAPRKFKNPNKAWVFAANYIESVDEILNDFLYQPKERILQNYKTYNNWKKRLIKETEEL